MSEPDEAYANSLYEAGYHDGYEPNWEAEAERWGDEAHDAIRREVEWYLDEHYGFADQGDRELLCDAAFAELDPDDVNPPDCEGPNYSAYVRADAMPRLRAALAAEWREISRVRHDERRRGLPPAWLGATRRGCVLGVLRHTRPGLRPRRRRTARRIRASARGPDGDSGEGEPPLAAAGVSLPHRWCS